MESSRNPLVCPPIRAQGGVPVPGSSLTGRIQQFPQAPLRTAADQRGVRIEPCGFLEESVWSPRGFLELSTISCTCVNNWVNQVEQLEERSRMNPGQPGSLHRRRVFILETPRGHPHGTTPCDQRIRPQSTESTAPTTTSVLLIRDLSSKQGVWKVGGTARLRNRSSSSQGRQRGRSTDRRVIQAHGSRRHGARSAPLMAPVSSLLRTRPSVTPEGRARCACRARVRFDVGRLCQTAKAADSAGPFRAPTLTSRQQTTEPGEDRSGDGACEHEVSGRP